MSGRALLVERALVAVAFLVGLAIRIPTLGLPLIEWHGWRQTMTAYTALIFHESGIDLLHPQLPIFGPPYELPMEFPAQQAVAALVMNAGVEPDLAARLTNLAAFFLSAALLYGLVRRVAGPVAAFAAAVVFLFLPTNILWSRASLVEYGATAGALGFLWAGIAWRERPRWGMLAIALAAGTVGILIKPTTPIFWTLPLLFWRVPGEPAGLAGWIRARLDPALVVLCVVPTAITFAWTIWADSIKAAEEAAAFLTSGALRSFYYASVAERIDPVIWKRTLFWLSSYVVGTGILPIFAVGLWAAWRSSRPAFWGGMLLAALVPFAIFYGGYYRHDYYWAAVTPEVAAIVGLGVAWLVSRARTITRRAAVGAALVVAAALTYSSARDYIDVATQPYRVLFSWDPTVDPIWLARYFPWNGVIAPHTYTLGAAPRDLRGAPIVTSDDTAALDAATRSARSLLAQPLHVPCDLAGHEIPAGISGTWLRLRPDAGARISPSAVLAPVAVRSVLVLAPSVSFGLGVTSVFCAGSPEIVIEAAFDAPPPG